MCHSLHGVPPLLTCCGYAGCSHVSVRRGIPLTLIYFPLTFQRCAGTICVDIRMNEGAPRLHRLSLSQDSRRIHEGGLKVKQKNAIFLSTLGKSSIYAYCRGLGGHRGTFSGSRRYPHAFGGSNPGGNC